MTVCATLSYLAVMLMLPSCMLATCCDENQNLSAAVTCRIFATNDTAYAICTTGPFNDSSPYITHDDYPCWTTPSKVICDRLELYPTWCMSERCAGIIETVISKIPPSVISVAILILQANGTDFQCEIATPQNFGNVSSIEAVSLLDVSCVNIKCRSSDK